MSPYDDPAVRDGLMELERLDAFDRGVPSRFSDEEINRMIIRVRARGREEMRQWISPTTPKAPSDSPTR